MSPTTSGEDRVHLHFALGKHFEDNGFYEQAFTHYDQGNRLKRAPSRYSIEKNRTEMRRIIAGTTSRLFERDEGAGFPANDPIFIVGMPRAGSTLVEQILASHSLVDGTLELPNIVSIAHGLNGRRFINEVHAYPGVLSSLDGSELAILGQRYIEETAIFRERAPFFTDKMPNNFKHIGLIALILPMSVSSTLDDIRYHAVSATSSSCLLKVKSLPMVWRRLALTMQIT